MPLLGVPRQCPRVGCRTGRRGRNPPACATHTSLRALPQMDSNMDKETVRYEITEMRQWVQEACGIPASEVQGFRNP